MITIGAYGEFGSRDILHGDWRHTYLMSCPKCGGNAFNIIAPGYFECTSRILVPGPVATVGGTVIMPVPAAVCGYRYQAGTPGTTPLCSCGTFAIGVCQDCNAPVDGDCSLVMDGQRLCRPCAQTRQARQAEDERARDRGAVDAVIDAVKTKPDPIERLLRIAWFLDKYEGRQDAWKAACPEYPRGAWDSAAIGRWFAARAVALGVKPTKMLPTYVARPVARLTLMLGAPGYDSGPDIPCWAFREASTDIRTVKPRDARFDNFTEPYDVTQWAHVLRDGRVVTYDPPPLKARGGPRARDDVAGTEILRPTGLNETGIVLMAALLDLTDERPGLKVKHRPINYGSGTRDMMRNLDRTYVDDYGRPRKQQR